MTSSNVPPVVPNSNPGGWESRSYVLPILITLCCCLPGGIVAIVFTAQANTAGASGNAALAEKNLATARTWMIVSAVLGVISGIVGAILNVLGLFAQASQSGA